MKPRKNFRTRPKKHGAKKRQKVLAQERRLIALGCDKERLDKLNTVEIRELLKETAGKRGARSLLARKVMAKK
ncbi:MAG: hypothetical protein U9R44_00375 [Candidatus Omnitrophota bacterium]|nr:hypothetical protein [Candidatus Omnitrophota bacterium]